MHLTDINMKQNGGTSPSLIAQATVPRFSNGNPLLFREVSFKIIWL